MFSPEVRSLATALCLSASIISALSNCQSKGSDSETAATTTANATVPTAAANRPVDPTAIPAAKIADAATILSRPQVPVLCYHQIRDWRARDSKDYIMPPAIFREQMQMLADSGYHAVLPDQLYAYLTTGAPLPAKPVLITFDDGDLTHYTEALPVLDKHGFKATFFIMTASIGRRGKQHYMDKAQLKDLADRGHEIGAHTWDHQNVKKYGAGDWKIQVEQPNAKLEGITGKPVHYFAYPFGLWNEAALPELQKRGYLAAFTLAKGRDAQYPLQTVRRMIAGGPWKREVLYRNMVQTFE